MRRLTRAIAIAAALLAAAACDTDSSDQGAQDDESDAGVDPRSILDGGDALGDCDLEDADCRADIDDLKYDVVDGELVMVLSMAGPFPDDGTFEIFWIPPDAAIPGLSFRYHDGAFDFWSVLCAETKHEGCHWSAVDPPESFAGSWSTDRRFRCRAKLDELGYGDLSSLKAGVGAAHEAITATAEFTDRFPDELWITATEILGLASIEL